MNIPREMSTVKVTIIYPTYQMDRKQQLAQLYQNMPKDNQGRICQPDLIRLILFLVDGEDNTVNPQNHNNAQPGDIPDNNEEWHDWINSDSE